MNYVREEYTESCVNFGYWRFEMQDNEMMKDIINDSFILSRLHQRGATVVERFVFFAKPLTRVAQ